MEAGADMLNDIWGFLYDEKMAELAARYDVPVCLMHNRDNTEYQDFVPDVVADLKKCLTVAEKYGVKKKTLCWIRGLDLVRRMSRILLS